MTAARIRIIEIALPAIGLRPTHPKRSIDNPESFGNVPQRHDSWIPLAQLEGWQLARDRVALYGTFYRLRVGLPTRYPG